METLAWYSALLSCMNKTSKCFNKRFQLQVLCRCIKYLEREFCLLFDSNKIVSFKKIHVV